MKIVRGSLLITAVFSAAAACSSATGNNGGADDGDSLAGGDNDNGGDAAAGDDAGNGDSGGDAAAGDDAGNGDNASGGDSGGVALDCSSCHGSSANNAPPVGLAGVTDPTEPGIGAHQAHVAGGAWHRPVACEECHLVPANLDDPGHMDTLPPAELSFAFPANAAGATPAYDFDTTSCSDTYCHGVTLKGPIAGGSVARMPDWTVTDGTYSACGASCHTNPPAPPHAATDLCGACHRSVIEQYDPDDPAASVWNDASLHINGALDVVGLSCTSCHGSAADGRINPPRGPGGETETTDAAVGAHIEHLTAGSGWHRDVQCTDCHLVPNLTSHANGLLDLPWGGPADADGASPDYDQSSNVCSNVYCHGSTLAGPTPGGTINRDPVWTVVDGTYDSCGDTCHTLPPAAPHPAVSSGCESCHGAVISEFDSADPPSSTWADPSLHINGTVDVQGMSCTSCHGDAGAGNVNPPRGTGGETETTQAAVGAHVQHLQSSSGWHADVECDDCHTVPTSVTHANGSSEIVWGAPANTDGASPAYDSGGTTCSNVYCHGSTLLGPRAGGVINRVPSWTVVDGTYDSCGDTCHTLPPASPHPGATACETCHGATITAFDATTPSNTVFNDPALHINGTVEVSGLTCTSCHGDSGTGAINPPVGTNGETLSSEPAVGAHETHLQVGAAWHRDVECTDCHLLPATTAHSNGVTDFNWTDPANVDGASPSYAGTTCSGVYCHGATLQPANTGGSVARSPDWTSSDGTYDACGSSCHTNPPGGTHGTYTDCTICHTAVIASFNSSNDTASWANESLHVDGIRQTNPYHDLTGWREPRDGADHHGSSYFLLNQQRDEHDVSCTQCHGMNLRGGGVGVSCYNSSCHGGDWTDCTFCHGDSGAGAYNPPVGVGGETGTDTLAVGKHVTHVNASTSHTGYWCEVCHMVPTIGNVSHTLGYVPSADLSTTGHHGDVMFSGQAAGMTWDVSQTAGTPIDSRGTCAWACHSDGRGGSPAVTPWWAGGTWDATPCDNCHGDPPDSGMHSTHDSYDCSECHPPVNGVTHTDGDADVRSDPGGLLTFTPDGCGGGVPSCGNGTCHGENHQSGAECW